MVKIDNSDLKMLFELEKNSRITDTSLGKLIHKSKETARYRIDKLKDEGYLKGYTIFIDPSALGYYSGKIYLKLANNKKRKEELISKIKSDPNVFWLGTADGAWDVGITYYVKKQSEFYDKKNELFADFHDIILNTDTGVLVKVHVGNKIFLSKSKRSIITLWDKSKFFEIDEIEKNLIYELFSNSRMSLVNLSTKLNTSIDKIRTRMKRLESFGVIAQYKSIINYDKLGYEFYKTFLTTKGFSSSEKRMLMDFLFSNSSVVHVVEQISPWDFEIELYCKSYHEYYAFIDSLTAQFHQIVNVQTAIMNSDYIFPAKKLPFD